MSTNRISEERINQFLEGSDEQNKIISIECSYGDDEASIIYRDDNDKKRIKKEPFKPFLWAKQSGARKLFIDSKVGYQNKTLLKKKLSEYGISVKGLNIHTSDGRTTKRLENGYRIMFTADKSMSYNKFIKFFKDGGVDIYDESKDFLSVSPVEQFMMRTGKRFFKGVEDYDELVRLQFDLETGGLNPEIHRINQIGITTNKGYQNIIAIDGETKSEKNKNELNAIKLLFKTISEIKPDVITGHNSENFDWNFIIVRCEMLGTTVEEVSKEFFRQGLYKSKKKTVLKLGGEIEYFFKTNLWGYNITDSLHAVRRAQAIDSNMKKADLKYVTKYSKLKKPDRVYIPGDKIVRTWNDIENSYALNNSNGDWYIINTKNSLKDGYEKVTGKYLVERYLKDDLYETDKVELRYNQPNFLLGKLLPTTFSRVCTMGTAGIWKLIMMAWSYENNLGIPDFSESKSFTGGLSRLLKVGFVDDVVKLDYNSLYPSIDITWEVEPDHDISHVMLSLLTYILDQREKYKDLKSVCSKKAKELKKKLETINPDTDEYIILKKEIKHYESETNSFDKRQLPLKILANSFFGSFGAPNLFPWGDVICAEKTTCVGRQGLRLMVKWFTDKGYEAIVGDSFTSDTPVFIKYDDNNLINITPISKIFDETEKKIDLLGMEYDYSEKKFKVLSRSGWVEPSYIYRHKTNKDIHRITDGDMVVDVTSDHSLFDKNKEQIHSKNINSDTELEYYEGEIKIDYFINIEESEAISLGMKLGIGEIDVVPIEILNSNINIQSIFFKEFLKNNNGNLLNIENRSKSCLAGLFFIKNKITS